MQTILHTTGWISSKALLYSTGNHIQYPVINHNRKNIKKECLHEYNWGFPDSSTGKELTCNAGDPGLIPGLGRSPGEGKGYPLQYSGLENSMDCIVHGVTKSQTQLSNFHFHEYN